MIFERRYIDDLIDIFRFDGQKKVREVLGYYHKIKYDMTPRQAYKATIIQYTKGE